MSRSLLNKLWRGSSVGPAAPNGVAGRYEHPVREAVTMADTRRLPGPNADVWDWQLEGSCRGMDSAFFFHPDGERGPARARREARAKAVCQSCPGPEPCP